MKADALPSFFPEWFRRDAAVVLGFNVLFFFFLATRTMGQSGLFAPIVLVVGLVIAVLGIGLRGLRWPPRREDRSALFIASAATLLSAGQVVTIEGIILGHPLQVPSAADLFRIAGYPLALAAVLSLPTRPTPLMVRARIILDGLMFLTAIMTVSWYFIIGPTSIPGSSSFLKLFVANANLGGDILLLLGLAFLAFQLRERRLHLTILLFGVCFIAIAVTDAIYSRQLLDGSFAPASLVNVGWSLGWMFGILGAASSRRIPTGDQASVPRPAVTVGGWSIWRSVHPYVLVPLIGGVFYYAWHVDAESPLIDGVAIGFGLLLYIVLFRAALVETENRRLYRVLVATNRRLAAQATIDPLTDLPNHRALVEVVDAEIERAKRFERPFAVLFCDLDHFKEVNDTYGHAAGDAALGHFGRLVRRGIRASDVVGRWGGEEFLIILPEVDAAGASLLAERLRITVAHRDRVLKGHRLTLSIGVAIYPDDGLTRDGLINAADLAMYRAKTLGRNQVRIASDPVVTQLGATDTGHRQHPGP